MLYSKYTLGNLNSKKIVLIFNSAFKYENENHFEFYKLSEKRINTLHFKETDDSWYLAHIDEIKSIIKKHLSGIEKIYTLGISKGGYAALLFGSMFNAEIFSINPQTNLTREFENLCIENGAISYISKFNDHTKYKAEYYKLNKILSNAYTHIHIFCGTDEYDNMHVQELKHMPKISIIQYNTNIHKLFDDFYVKQDIYTKLYEKLLD